MSTLVHTVAAGAGFTSPDGTDIASRIMVIHVLFGASATACVIQGVSPIPASGPAPPQPLLNLIESARVDTYFPNGMEIDAIGGPETAVASLECSLLDQ